jgi:hypothetical protein
MKFYIRLSLLIGSYYYKLILKGVLIDKLRPLDLKLKYQIDTLLKVANSTDPLASVQSLNTLRRTPNLKSFNKEGEDRIDPNGMPYIH